MKKLSTKRSLDNLFHLNTIEIVKESNKKLRMKKEDIIAEIKKAQVNSDNSTEMLVFYDSNHSYCVHGMKWPDKTEIVVTHLYPGRVHQIDEIPEDIDSMKAMWYEDLMSEFEDIYEAMRSFKQDES
jgi:hypothetical protein